MFTLLSFVASCMVLILSALSTILHVIKGGVTLQGYIVAAVFIAIAVILVITTFKEYKEENLD